MTTQPPSPPLTWRNVDAIPLIHGRLPFALEVRRRLLDQRYAALAVELPPSLRPFLQEGVRRLPVIHAVVYREPTFAMEWGVSQEEQRGKRAWFVPVDPCDGIVEALRFTEREPMAVHFVDAEVEEFSGRTALMPDSFALLSLGLEPWYQALLPVLRESHRPTPEDRLREAHMAARVAELSRKVGNRGRILFLCGLSHWERIHQHLENDTGRPDASAGPDRNDIELVPLEEPLLHAILGEMPFASWSWEQHRAGISLDDHDAIHSVKELLVAARDRYEARHDGASLERASPGSLRTMLDFARKMTVRRRRLVPDLYTLVVAAKGVVGNDFALTLVDVARSYPPNHRLPPPELPDTAEMTEDDLEEPRGEQWISRAPGEHREMKRVRLVDRPPKIDQERWRSAWSPHHQCSWPPEDVVVENLRAYVSQRCLSLAGLDRMRTEEFTASLKDGLDLRETLRDPRGKLHVREEPRVPGQVGAVVLIFEEDDAGLRYPWRTTWLAEHDQESTLAFYATDYLADIVGPGIGRARYGGCMFLFPPILIPDVWEDLRFEKARRPSERLLLAALAWSPDRFVAYIANRPPSPEIRTTAQAMGKHIVHLPLSSFSARTLEKARKVHVLNGQFVRSWAAQFIR